MPTETGAIVAQLINRGHADIKQEKDNHRAEHFARAEKSVSRLFARADSEEIEVADLADYLEAYGSSSAPTSAPALASGSTTLAIDGSASPEEELNAALAIIYSSPLVPDGKKHATNRIFNADHPQFIDVHTDGTPKVVPEAVQKQLKSLEATNESLKDDHARELEAKDADIADRDTKIAEKDAEIEELKKSSGLDSLKEVADALAPIYEAYGDAQPNHHIFGRSDTYELSAEQHQIIDEGFKKIDKIIDDSPLDTSGK